MTLTPEALTRAAFAPFGDVIQSDGAKSYPINDGMCTRFHDLAAVDARVNELTKMSTIIHPVAEKLIRQATEIIHNNGKNLSQSWKFGKAKQNTFETKSQKSNSPIMIKGQKYYTIY